MKTMNRAMAAIAALGVAGCSSLPGANLGDTFLVEGFMNQELAGGSYTDELARAYQARTVAEATEDTNWYDATAFYNKGQAALAGEEVMPWNPADFGHGGELVTGYDNTVAAAAQYKDIRPAACAQMVANYDHWLEEVREEDHSIVDPGKRQEDWAAAYYECSGGAVPPGTDARWIVYFGFDRSDLDAQARKTVDEIVEAVRGTVPTLSVVGHADTVGSKAYNQALSERRARTVRDAIKAQGVDTSNSSVAGRSELDLAVPTGDGVAEPLNRRVTVEVQ